MGKYLSAAAVMVGSLILFIPLSAIALLNFFEFVRMILGIERVGSEGVRLFMGVLIVAFAYVTAMEIARVQLHGVEELRRGTRVRNLSRHGVLVLVVVAAIVSLVEFFLDALTVGIENGQLVVAIGSAASLVALGWVVVRSLKSFRDTVQRSP